MTTIQRLTHSSVLITTDSGATLIDPDTFSWGSDDIDKDSLGDIQRVLISHEHFDHVSTDFVKWLQDRGTDVTVHANDNVVALLAAADIEAVTTSPEGVTFEDCEHGTLPNGSTVPNRAYTVDGVLTHTGDSWELTSTAPVMSLPLFVPWGQMLGAMEAARRLKPAQVIPAHDFYLHAGGKEFIHGMAAGILAESGIEFVPLKDGDSYTV